MTDPHFQDMKNLNWIANLHRNNFQMKYRNLWEKHGPRLRRKLLARKFRRAKITSNLSYCLKKQTPELANDGIAAYFPRLQVYECGGVGSAARIMCLRCSTPHYMYAFSAVLLQL